MGDHSSHGLVGATPPGLSRQAQRDPHRVDLSTGRGEAQQRNGVVVTQMAAAQNGGCTGMCCGCRLVIAKSPVLLQGADLPSVDLPDRQCLSVSHPSATNTRTVSTRLEALYIETLPNDGRRQIPVCVHLLHAV